MNFSHLSVPQKTDLLISFMDIQGFTGISQALPDAVKLFDLMNDWAAIVIREIDRTTGRIVKFIGDACLAVFPENEVDAGVLALLSIKQKTEAFLKERGFPNKLRITAHFGEAVIGLLGEGAYRSVDVMGDSINVAATLGRGDHRGRLIISPQAFRKLSDATRKRFHKHTPPIVYLAEDR